MARNFERAPLHKEKFRGLLTSRAARLSVEGVSLAVERASIMFLFCGLWVLTDVIITMQNPATQKRGLKPYGAHGTIKEVARSSRQDAKQENLCDYARLAKGCTLSSRRHQGKWLLHNRHRIMW